jgi:beta-ureidopropionase / N-carbamoyl-L-amino-acid hydrolase
MPMPTLRSRVKPERALRDLSELTRLTGDERGTQRVCWTPGWMRAVDWFQERLVDAGAKVFCDPAGNLWGTIAEPTSRLLVLGSHLDSVPDGGRLDGAYGSVAALEVLRTAAAGTGQAPSLAVVAFADEEGARFGPSLGSAGVTGTFDRTWADLKDQSGTTLAQAASECGVDVARANDASSVLRRVRAYLELHIEQGPWLEHAGKRLAVVTGTVAMRRERLIVTGVANHAAATPMGLRHDALAAAAEVLTGVRRIAAGVPLATGTVAEISVVPNVWSVVPDRVQLIVDMRAPTDAEVNAMFSELRALAESVASELGVSLNWELVRRHSSQPFDAHLIELGDRVLELLGAGPEHMMSGAMHDATVMASVVPAVMLFVPSIGGVSHVRHENTREEDLVLGIRALAALADLALEQA